MVTSPDIDHALLLADPDMWHRARGEQVRVWLSSDGPETPPEKVPDPSRVWVYRHDTFAKIHFAVLKLGGRLGDLCRMLDPKVPQPRRDELRATLSHEPDI